MPRYALPCSPWSSIVGDNGVVHTVVVRTHEDVTSVPSSGAREQWTGGSPAEGNHAAAHGLKTSCSAVQPSGAWTLLAR